MLLKYDVLREDALALAVHHLETSARHRPMRLAMLWGLPVLVFSLLVLTLPTKYGLVAGALFACTYALRIPGLMRRSCERNARKWLDGEEGRRALGPHVLAIEQGGFALEAPAGRARFAEAAVHDVTEAAQHLFVGFHSGAAFVVPKRSLSADELEAVRRLDPSKARATLQGAVDQGTQEASELDGRGEA